MNRKAKSRHKRENRLSFKKYEGIGKPPHNSRKIKFIDGEKVRCRINYPFGRRSKPRITEIKNE
jgi:hypothetical protein